MIEFLTNPLFIFALLMSALYAFFGLLNKK